MKITKKTPICVSILIDPKTLAKPMAELELLIEAQLKELKRDLVIEVINRRRMHGYE